MQISDIHLSYVNNLSVSDSLHYFCHKVVGTIKPSLILVTGDLTHAKFPDDRRSQQFMSEWVAYSNILKKCNLGNIPWLDIRGNHGMYVIIIATISTLIHVHYPDNFDVPSYSDTSNYFRYEISPVVPPYPYPYPPPSQLNCCNLISEYSMSWKKHKSRSYSYVHRTSFGVYNFIAVDACPNPGPKRPYNFFGVLTAVSTPCL